MSESFLENTETPKPLELKAYYEKVDGEGVEKRTENATKDEINVKHELSNSEEFENGHALKRAKLEESLKNKNTIIVVPPTKPQLFYSPLKTGLVYDVRMRYHAKIFTSYFEYIDPHPEDPRRIYRISKKLAEAGLIQDSS